MPALLLSLLVVLLAAPQASARPIEPFAMRAQDVEEAAEPTAEPPPTVLPTPAGPSRALGRPNRGRLVGGVQLPISGTHHLTWDPILKQVPNRGWRRWATLDTLHRLLYVAQEYRQANPDAPPLLIGDLSRRRGGDFTARVGGGLGHASHQNGIDVDVYYPRKDRLPRAALRPSQVDRELAQDLVDRFLEQGATFLFVGPRLGLKGPRRIVVPLRYHDDHVHVRFAGRAGS